MRNRTSLKDEADKTILLIFNVSTSTSGHCWPQSASELQGLVLGRAGCFYVLWDLLLAEFLVWKRKYLHTSFPLLNSMPPSPALQVLALTHLGTRGAIPMPRPGSGRAPGAALLQTPCLCQPSQTTRANTTCHRADKHAEVEPTIFIS